MVGRGASLDEVTGRLAEELRQRTGLTPEAVQQVSELYTVTVQPKKRGLLSRRPDPSTGTGTTYEEALAAAAKGQEYETDLQLSVERKVDVPYFTETAVARSL